MTPLIKASLLFCLCFVCACQQGENELLENNQQTPNFVFILADDLGLYDLSVNGSDFYQTPNLDQLAARSTVFTQGYSASSVCSPSRASIMTGQFTARHGVTDWIGAKTGQEWRSLNRNDKTLPPDYRPQLRPQDTTIAEALLAAGYNTFFAGKWHLGDDDSSPQKHGFELNLGGWRSGAPRGGYFSPWRNPKLENQHQAENLSMRLANETSEFIRAHQSEPFFAFLSFYAVHSPLQTTQAKWQKYRDIADANGLSDNAFEMERILPYRVTQDHPVYAGMVEQMDEAIGLVLEAINTAGLSDNTVVIFTSDNGGVVSGDVYATSNLPLRGGKGYQWEGGVRTPYFMHIPKQAAQSIDYPVSGIDFYPTMLELANLQPSQSHLIDGISLVPLLRSSEVSTTLPQRPLFWHYPHYGNQGGEPASIIRNGDWKLIHYHESGQDELYNLIEDPAEKRNLVEQQPEQTNSLKTQLVAFLDSVEAKFPLDDELHDPELAIQQRNDTIDILLPSLEQQRLDFLSPDYNPGNNWWDSQTTTQAD